MILADGKGGGTESGCKEESNNWAMSLSRAPIPEASFDGFMIHGRTRSMVGFVLVHPVLCSDTRAWSAAQ